MRTPLKLSYFVCFALMVSGLFAKPTKPNVILFLVDDMGWMDSTVYGSEYYETPNMERLAERGVVFTNAYAANPLCSPTRASLMTGKYPGRLNLTTASGHLAPETDSPPLPESGQPWQKVLTPNVRHYLPLEEYTLAEAFRDNGYETVFIGKWHLGHEPWWPDKNGFNINIAGGEYAGPPSYFSPYLIKSLEDGPKGEYLTERLTTEAISFMQSEQEKPYFMCLWHYAVHSPYQEKEDVSARYRTKTDPRGKQDCAIMAAMIEGMDQSLGAILDALDASGQAENTIIAFTSDNGGNMYDSVEGTTPTNNAPLTSGKGNIHEGGVRVPAIFVWPGEVDGGERSDAIISTIDYYPTLLEIAGLPLPEQPLLDGVSIAAHLKDGQPLDREAIFCHFPHYVSATLNLPATSVRSGPWKLIRTYGEGADYAPAIELYNLDDDIEETHDLSHQMPDKVAELDAMITRHLKETGSIVPVVNTSHVPGAIHPDFTAPDPPLGGWSPAGCKLSAENGRLIIDSLGGDAYIMSEAFELHEGPLTVTIRMSSTSTGVGQLFYKANTPYYSSKRKANFAVQHDGAIHTYTVNLPEGVLVDCIRLDPCMSQGRVEVDEIRVSDADGRLVRNWDFTKVERGERQAAEPAQKWP